MRVAVWRHGPGQIYRPDQLRVKRLLPTDIDEEEAVKRYSALDPSLTNFVGVFDAASQPLDGGLFNAWRHDGTSFSVDMAHAQQLRYASLLSDRNDRVLEIQQAVGRANSALTIDPAAVKLLTDKIGRLQAMEAAIRPQVLAAKTPQDLLAIGYPDLA